MLQLVAGLRGLGAAPDFANKRDLAVVEQMPRVAPIASRDSQAGDQIHPRG